MDQAQSATAQRASELLADERQKTYRDTDRLFAGLMVFQYLGGIAAALWISPRTWVGAESQPHLHVWAAVVLGALITGVPVALAVLRPGRVSTRHAIAAGQALTSALLIHLMGGRIETHFHVFGSLAFLAFYRDWRVLITASAIVAVDHLVRGVYWPQSVFGVLAASPWRWLEHAAWVIFEDVFLIRSCILGQRQSARMADRQARIEATNTIVEAEVQARTAELSASNKKLVSTEAALRGANVLLEERSHKAEVATQAKTDFLANMSHEIRTPMTAILGYSEYLLDPELSAQDRREAGDTIWRNVNHLLDIINNILDISKIEAGKLELENRTCSPSQILEEVMTLMHVRAQARGLALVLEYDGELPVGIRSDPTRLKQILVNLVGNAIKFTEIGEVRLVARLLSCGTGGEPQLEIEVRDTGIGMTREELDRLFQPFTQADETTTRRFGGTGLGLSISQRLAALLGGAVAVSSERGVGTKMTLRVATGALEETRMIACRAEGEPARPGPASKSSTQIDCRVLLAEDGPDNQRLISFLLSRAGAEVTVAKNGRLAVELARASSVEGRPFDVILMDMQMPEMDGYEAAETLRDGGWEGVIIALTAHAMLGAREKCLAVGCDDFATKPVGREALIQLIADHLPRRAGGVT